MLSDDTSGKRLARYSEPAHGFFFVGGCANGLANLTTMSNVTRQTANVFLDSAHALANVSP